MCCRCRGPASLALFFSLSLSSPFSFLSYRLINPDTFSPQILCFLCSRFPFSAVLCSRLNFPPFSLSLSLSLSRSSSLSLALSTLRFLAPDGGQTSSCRGPLSCLFICSFLFIFAFSGLLLCIIWMSNVKCVLFSVSPSLSSQACGGLQHPRHGQTLPPARWVHSLLSVRVCDFYESRRDTIVSVCVALFSWFHHLCFIIDLKP